MWFCQIIPFISLLLLKFIVDATPKKCISILTFRKHADLSARQITENLSLAKSTVGQILKRVDDTGDCGVLRQGGCRRNSVKDPKKISKDLQKFCSSINVNSSTV